MRDENYLNDVVWGSKRHVGILGFSTMIFHFLGGLYGLGIPVLIGLVGFLTFLEHRFFLKQPTRILLIYLAMVATWFGYLGWMRLVIEENVPFTSFFALYIASLLYEIIYVNFCIENSGGSSD